MRRSAAAPIRSFVGFVLDSPSNIQLTVAFDARIGRDPIGNHGQGDHNAQAGEARVFL